MANTAYAASVGTIVGNIHSTIFLNYFELERKITDVESIGNSISKSVGSVGDVSQASGIMLKEYIDRMNTISQMIGQYKLLLEKDIADVREAEKVLNEADRKKAADMARVVNSMRIL